MFPKFRQSFSPDAGRKPDPVSIDTGVPSLNELLSSFSGVSFNHGLYRIVRAQDLAAWSSRIVVGFPAFAGRITCFGYDWLGRTFAIDTKRAVDGEPGVVMFEPGTGEALQIPANIRTFHETELDEYQDAALASNFTRHGAGMVAPNLPMTNASATRCRSSWAAKTIVQIWS